MNALFIVNPHAHHSRDDFRAVFNRFRERGWQLDHVRTQTHEDGTEQARAGAEAGYDVVVACGGDGTVNSVLNGLVGTETALAALPLGTSNMWMSEVGIPNDLIQAADALVEGRVQRVDVGQAGNEYFLVMSGVGLVTEMLKSPLPESRETLGKLSFLLNGVLKAFDFRAPRTILQVDDRHLWRQSDLVVVGNIPVRAESTNITPQAKVDDGRLDVAIFSERPSPVDWLRQIARALLHQPSPDSGYEYLQGRAIRIWTSRELDVQTDGELRVRTPVHIRVCPRALKVLVPRSVSDSRPSLSH